MDPQPDPNPQTPAPAAVQRIEEWPLTPQRVRIWEDEFRVLHAAADGHEFHNLRPRSLFPLSAKADYISLLDEKSREVILLEHPDQLDAQSRATLAATLERTYYTAMILRVDELSETMGVTTWQVLTDHGYARFEVVDREQHIRPLPNGRYALVDVDGNRFEIPDVSRLDPHSQELVYHET